MAERVLSTRDLNRAILARQLLLERSKLPLTKALEQIAGLQSQYAPSAYVGLWSRLVRFQREALTQALVRRQAVQATLMRATIHIVSARDFHLFAAAIRRQRREWWERVQARELRGIDMKAASAFARKLLSEAPLRWKDIADRFEAEGFPKIAARSVGMWVDLVRVPPSGTWDQRRADLYGLADDWLDGRPATEAQGLEHLVRRYLGGFGPATLADIASWSGLSGALLRPIVDGLHLRRLRDEKGGELLDVPGAPIPEPDTPAPPRFLPTWDATLLVHCRRAQILPERYRPLIFTTKNPQSVSTILVDGAVAGTWDYQAGRIRINPFDSLSASARRELEAEANALAGFHGAGRT